EKKAALEKAGVTPYPHSFDKKHTIAQARQAEGEEVQTAGRIMAVREHGKVVFFDLQDSTAKMQVMIREEQVGAEAFQLLSFVDAGDFLGVTGTVAPSRTGEITILVSQYTFLGKAL